MYAPAGSVLPRGVGVYVTPSTYQLLIFFWCMGVWGMPCFEHQHALGSTRDVLRIPTYQMSDSLHFALVPRDKMKLKGEMSSWNFSTAPLISDFWTICFYFFASPKMRWSFLCSTNLLKEVVVHPCFNRFPRAVHWLPGEALCGMTFSFTIADPRISGCPLIGCSTGFGTLCFSTGMFSELGELLGDF